MNHSKDIYSHNESTCNVDGTLSASFHSPNRVGTQKQQQQQQQQQHLCHGSSSDTAANKINPYYLIG